MSDPTDDANLPVTIQPGKMIAFRYTNWEGKVADRRVQVAGFAWGSSKWHPNPGWLMLAVDVDRGVTRLFEMAAMENVRHVG